MAEFINQQEIDALLNSVLNNPNDEKTDQKKEEKTDSTEPVKNKYFKAQKAEGLRYPSLYRSPIIKKEDVVFDPVHHESEIDGKVVVRTLRNFLQSLQHKGRKSHNISIDKR